MKIYTKEVTLNTPKNIKDTRIVCFSDLHYSKLLGLNTLDSIYKNILEYNPDYICFLGDLINDDSFDVVYDFIKRLSGIAPVLLIDGNHDIKSFKVADRIHYNKNHTLTNELKAELDRIPNVFYLTNNRSVEFDGITFTGSDFFHQSHEQDFWDFLDYNVPNIDDDSYNIFLCHNPFLITKEAFSIIDDTYQDLDAVFTGHIHNALMPAYIDNKFKANLGIYTKDTGLFPIGYLGEKEMQVGEDKSIVISNVPPIRTFNPENPLFNSLNALYPPTIKRVRLKKKN